MAIGPTQLLIVLGLDRRDFHEALLAELERLHEEGIVCLLDAIAVDKGSDGAVQVRQLGDAGADTSIGIDRGLDVLAEVPDGSSAALVLLEHHWAWRLHDVIAALGGFAVSDGFIISPLDPDRFAASRLAAQARADGRVGDVQPAI